MKRFAVPVVLALFCGLMLQAVPNAGSAKSKRPEPTVVQDLHYGEVLFYFFQADYFSAITRLLAAQSWQQLEHHEDEAELLLGGLYLSYGQHQQAGRIFEALLADNVEQSVRDRTWFFLAKVWYQRGYLDQAEAALGRIEDKLPSKELEGERRMLHASMLMADGRFEEAQELLAGWKRPRDWNGYVQFNLGVALVRQGKVAEGARLLDQVGQLEGSNEELAGLRDKANVALGYAYLQSNQPDAAKVPLQRVRLRGPFSNKALLGVGWADSAVDRYRQALSPWMELRRRDLLDSAVQESLLAIPYAFGKLDANRQAADHYVDAIEAFHEEMGRIDQSIDTILDGRMVKAVLRDDTTNQMGWFWKLQELPDAPETRYLYHLMADHEFQEGLKNYGDLQFIHANLEHWSNSLVSFEQMIETRQYAYDTRTPVIDEALGRVDLDEMVDRRVEFESRLNQIETTEDHVALATPKEQRLWLDLSRMDARIDMLGTAPEAREIRDKHRFLKGLLYWDMKRAFKARLWKQRKTLRELDRGLKEAQRLRASVESSREDTPDKYVDFSGRVDALGPRIAMMQSKIDKLIQRQRDHLESQAVRELEAQKDRLSTYMVQARFALATIYDRSADISLRREPVAATDGDSQ